MIDQVKSVDKERIESGAINHLDEKQLVKIKGILSKLFRF